MHGWDFGADEPAITIRAARILASLNCANGALNRNEWGAFCANHQIFTLSFFVFALTL